jgi:glycosyltransferase involved in cell wall biosynthesis
MKTVFLVTAIPGVKCGVEDYTRKLQDSLSLQGKGAESEILPVWSFANLKMLFKKYTRRDHPLHLQYPSTGMGKSPSVAMLPLIFGPKRVVATLHEFSVFSLPRKLYFLPYALLKCTVIFSNEFEKNQFEAFFPFARCRRLIIPIGSNIDVAAPPVQARLKRVIYFGQIGQDKGLEDFIEIVRGLKDKGCAFEAVIMGSVTDANNPVVRMIMEQKQGLGLEIIQNASAERVSEELLKSTVALLPYPDGISEKRGTALACLEHGVIVVTRHSSKSPQWLIKATVPYQSVREAVTVLEQILNDKDPFRPDQNLLAAELAKTKWENIAKTHTALYESLAE